MASSFALRFALALALACFAVANGTGGSKEAPSAVSGKKAKRDRPLATPADAAAGATPGATPASGKKVKRDKKKDKDGAESAKKAASSS